MDVDGPVEEEVQVQDSAREDQLSRLLKLRRMPSRHGHDAEDEFGNPYELKSTTRGGVGTGRDVSQGMIDQWRTRYWICAKGRNLRSGFQISELYFLSPRMMEEWFQQMEEKFLADRELRDRVLARITDTVTPVETERIRYLIERGMTYNNPHISWIYIRRHGLKLDIRNGADQLRKMVGRYPLKL
jgi:hypothetical protein